MEATALTHLKAYVRGIWTRWLREVGPVNLKRGKHPGRHFDERVTQVSNDAARRLDVASIQVEEIVWGLWADGEIHEYLRAGI